MNSYAIRIYKTASIVFVCSCVSLTFKTNLTWASDLVKVENALLKTIESTVVSAEVTGKIEALTVVEGDEVRLNQPLGKIHDTAVMLRLERTKIAMAIARKKRQSDIDLRLAKGRAAVAQNELERAESANARLANTYGPKEVDRLRLVASSAQIEIERASYDRELFELEVLNAENEYRQAEELLAQHQIRSPAIGIVASLNRRVGEWVEPGTELLRIVRIDRLRVEGFISGAAASKNLVGSLAKVTVMVDGDAKLVEGRVVFVSTEANSINGQIRVYLEIDNSQGEFLPGMRVEASIEAGQPDLLEAVSTIPSRDNASGASSESP